METTVKRWDLSDVLTDSGIRDLEEDGAVLIFDGAAGIYNLERVQEFAKAMGWDGTVVGCGGCLSELPDGDDPEEVHWNVEECEAFLNDRAPEGTSFGWVDGDFFFARDDWEGWEY